MKIKKYILKMKKGGKEVGKKENGGREEKEERERR